MTGYEEIKALYATLPRIKCKGLCHDQCRGIYLTPAENKEIRRRKGAGIPTPDQARNAANRGTGINQLGLKTNPIDRSKVTCPLLDRITKRCTAYEVRPFICRAWGVTERMVCPHDCEIEGTPLTFKQEAQLTVTVQHLGDPRFTQEEYAREMAILEDPEMLAIREQYARQQISEHTYFKQVDAWRKEHGYT